MYTAKFLCKILVGSVITLYAGATLLWGQSDKKVAYGVLFDNTGSMRQLIPEQRKLANLIVNKVPKGSKISMYGFATASTYPPISSFAAGLECSNDLSEIEKQISEIVVVGGQTTLLDAILASAARLKNPSKKECDQSDEQILIILSDGEDRASSTRPEQLLTALKASGVRIYIIGIMKNLERQAGFITKTSNKKSKEILLTLAKETGGRIVFAKKKETAEEIVTNLFADNYSFPK